MQAIVIFSGGLDSTVVLFDAVREYGAHEVLALTFDYGQLMRAELDAAHEIAKLAGVVHETVDISGFARVCASAQTRTDIPMSVMDGCNDLPTTFTPSRNLVFIAIASSLALSRDVRRVLLGVNQPLGIGYPDCGQPFLEAAQHAVRVGNADATFEIRAPLLLKTKAEIVQHAVSLGDTCMHAITRSVTCYRGLRPGCGKCMACVQRRTGFEQAGVPDEVV